jgi:CYTH domain-containing protein
MSRARRFLIASSLARLIERERGGVPVTEGYFSRLKDRTVFVRLEDQASCLVLVAGESGDGVEERADLPRAHAESLLDMTDRQAGYVRTSLSLGERTVQILNFTAPQPLALAVVEFEEEEEARGFHPPPWFGPDVTPDPRYRMHAFDRTRDAPATEVELTHAALDGLLDILEEGPPAMEPAPIEPASMETTPPETAPVEPASMVPGLHDVELHQDPDKPVRVSAKFETVLRSGLEQEAESVTIEEAILRQLARAQKMMSP